jgi:tight adherence protein C
MFQGVGRIFMRYTPQGWGARVEKRLMIAGWSPRLDASSWAAIRVLTLIFGIVLAFFVNGQLQGSARLAGVVGSLVIGVLGAEAMLTRRVDERKSAMERDLPDVIDLLVISVEAGLGFEGALGRVVQNVPGELSDEFSRMLQETRVGVSRNQALRSLAERTDVDDLNTFIMALTQADAFGVSISRMLRVQADEMRVRRRLRAQERAFAAPVKMTFPLVLCIFPGIFVVLLGPAAIQITQTIL